MGIKNEMSKESKAKNRIVRRARVKAYINSRKEKSKCCICGEGRVCCLQFHHKDKAAKAFSISMATHDDIGIDRINREIDKCIVVCANCHAVLHMGDNGYNTGKTEEPLPLFDNDFK